VLVTSEVDSLTETRGRYTEGRLVQDAAQAGRATAANGTASAATAPKSHVADMELYPEQVRPVLPVLGLGITRTVGVTGLAGRRTPRERAGGCVTMASDHPGHSGKLLAILATRGGFKERRQWVSRLVKTLWKPGPEN
jgi:hypothetical protein